jgi:hypothetical protein
MTGRIIAVASAAVLVAGLSTGAAASASSAGAVASAASTGAEVRVAVGNITAATGRAIAGVTVKLYAWPSSSVLQKLRPGQAVPWKLLATTKTSATGTYALAVPRATLARAAAGNGYANLEIESTAGDWDFSDQTHPAAGRAPASATVNLGEVERPAFQNYCTTPGSPWIAVKGFYPEPSAVVGQGYVLKQKHTKGDYVTFEYTQGSSEKQNSSLGIGASGYGSSAGYSRTGSNTQTAVRAEGFPNFYQKNVWFRTEFTLEEFRMDCLVPVPLKHRPPQHGYCPTTYEGTPVDYCVWKLASTGWFGGASVQYPKTAPATSYRNCAYQIAGSHFGTDRGEAIEWSQGYEIGAGLGLKGVNIKVDYNASSQTGYDINAYMYYHFKEAGYICGTNGPPSKAAQLVARDNLPAR